MAKSLPKLGNTVILKSELEKHADDWAAHLKLIPDFLKPGEGVWWKEMEDHVEFFDGPEEANFRQEGPNLHHFRSSSIAMEHELLKICWEKCLQDKVKIPATKMRGDTGKWERPLTCCLVQWMADATDDENNSDETQMETVGSDAENEDLSDSDDEPEDDDGHHDNDHDDGDDYNNGDGAGDSDHHGNEEVTCSRKMNVH